MTDTSDRRGRAIFPEVLVVAAMGLVSLAVGTWLSIALVLSLPLVLLSGTALMLAFLTLHAILRKRACRIVPIDGTADVAPARNVPMGPGSAGVGGTSTAHRPSSEAGPRGVPVNEQVADPELRGSLATDEDLVIAPWPAELHSEPMAAVDDRSARSASPEPMPAGLAAAIGEEPRRHSPFVTAGTPFPVPHREGQDRRANAPPPIPIPISAPEFEPEPLTAPEVADEMMVRSIEALRTTQRSTQPALDHGRPFTASAAAAEPPSMVAESGTFIRATDVEAVATVTPESAASESARIGSGAAAEENSRAFEARPSAAARALSHSYAGGGLQLMLQPIADLGDGSARHLEISVEVGLEDGRALNGFELRRLAREAGLLSAIDGDKLAAAAGVVRRLAARGREGRPIDTTVHSGVAGESLIDDDFLDSFAATVVGEAAFTRHLVMAFAQEEVRAFTRAQWGALAIMAEHGFRFSLEAMTDLDMDFEALVRGGFAFVKLDADVFLRGMAVGENAIVPAADICRHLSGYGFALIVGRIDDERLLAEVMGFGVLLGQGALFGGPRPLKAAVRPVRAEASTTGVAA